MTIIDTALTIADVALRLGKTNRATLHPDGSPESDTTHTVMLAMLALECAPAELNRAKLLSFITVHDLPEYKHGDVCTAWGLTPDQARAKDAAEAEAVDELRAVGLARIVALIEEYERQDTPEARWVRYVDKVLPKLTHLLSHGQALRKVGMTRADMLRKRAEQGAELAERYPEQAHARALFEAACERCEAELLTGAEQDREAIRRLLVDCFRDVEVVGHGPDGYITARISLSQADVDKLKREQAETSRGYTVIAPGTGPTPEQEREAIEAMREAEAAAEIQGLRALVWGADGHGINTSTGRWEPTIVPAVLWSSDALSKAVNGDDVGELLIYSDQDPPGPGLWVWEGVGRYGAGADPEGDDTGELMLRGEYRPLAGPEILAALHGQPLPELEPPTHDEQAEVEGLRAQLCVAMGGLPDTTGFAESLRARATFLRGLHGRNVGSEPARLEGLAAEVEAVGDRFGYSEGSR